jgi:hypothetical protein
MLGRLALGTGHWFSGTNFAAAFRYAENGRQDVQRRSHWCGVRVRITETPREQELDGVALDTLQRGTVHDVSSILGSWLVTQGYAQVEMRQGVDALPSRGDSRDSRDSRDRGAGGDSSAGGPGGHVKPSLTHRREARRRRND